MNTSEMNTSETRKSEMNTSEMNTSETRKSEMNTSEMNTSETRKSENDDSSLNLPSTAQTIFREIYVEDGFKGVISSLFFFPTRLRDELLEDLSMNMYEWENKLTQNEKNEMIIKLREHTEKRFSEKKEDIISLIEENYSLQSTIKNKKNEKDFLISRIEEFPSILPQTDIDTISLLNEEIKNLYVQRKRVKESLNEISLLNEQEYIRENDTLF